MSHEIIYLIPEGDGNYVWCEDPAPGIGMDEADAIKYIRSDKVHDLQQKNAELEARLAREWVSMEDFETDAYEGWCWIVYKGRIVEAYRDHSYFFLFSKHSQNCYMTECISWVMKHYYPAPPPEDE